MDDVRDGTVAGEPALIVDVTTTVDLPEGLEYASHIFAEGVTEQTGTDVVFFDGTGRMRYVDLAGRNLAVIYSATAEAFAEDRFQAFLDTLEFLDE